MWIYQVGSRSLAKARRASRLVQPQECEVATPACSYRCVVDLCSGSLPPMANLDFGTCDLSSDNFDMANLDFPSLSFSVDHDDLNLMARMGSLFDLHAKDATTHNGQTTRQPPQYTQGAPHLAGSAQHPVQFEPASFSPASSPEFACLSQPVAAQQKQPQQVSGQQSLMPSFPQAFVSTPPASQVLCSCLLMHVVSSDYINKHHLCCWVMLIEMSVSVWTSVLYVHCAKVVVFQGWTAPLYVLSSFIKLMCGCSSCQPHLRSTATHLLTATAVSRSLSRQKSQTAIFQMSKVTLTTLTLQHLGAVPGKGMLQTLPKATTNNRCTLTFYLMPYSCS